jgi:hypothetical protein
MRKAELPDHLKGVAFALRTSDKAGVTRTRTRAKDLVPVSRGIRVPLSAQPSGADALRAYTDVDDASILALCSAARMIGIPVPAPQEGDWRIHLARRRGFAAPRRANVAGHRLTLTPDEVMEYDGARLTTPARTWLDLASMRNSVDDLVAAGDYLVNSHGEDFPFPRESICRIQELRDMIDRHPGLRGIRKAREALELIRVGADSVPESRMRLALITAGLPEPVLNFVVRGDSGLPVLWPDAAYPDHRISLQYDGEHHAREDQYQRDIVRAEVAARYGWHEVRIWLLVVLGVGVGVVGKVRSALAYRAQSALRAGRGAGH